MRSTRGLLIVVAMCACGRSETFPGVADSQAALDAGFSCDRDGGVPALSVVQGPDGQPLHWGNLDACIDVSYDVELAPLLDDLRVALSDWSFPGCTWICFTAPTAGGGRPLPTAHNDRRIHLALMADGEQPLSVTATTQINFAGGEIDSADILLRSQLAEPGQAPLLWLLGQVLGFEPTPAVDSALNDRMGVPSSLTPADEQSVCALYPTCR